MAKCWNCGEHIESNDEYARGYRDGRRDASRDVEALSLYRYDYIELPEAIKAAKGE